MANLTRQDGIEFLDVVPKAGIRATTVAYPLRKANEALAGSARRPLRRRRRPAAVIFKPPLVTKTARDLPPELTCLAGLTSVAVLQQLQCDATGLSEIEASRRRDLHGSNTIAHESSQSLLRDLAGRLINPLNCLLLILALVSLLTGDAKAATLVAAMVLLSLVLATVQERRSNRAAAKLRAMVHTTATVLRREGRHARRHSSNSSPVTS